jgi:ligand-binding sensor domain-containing protein
MRTIFVRPASVAMLLVSAMISMTCAAQDRSGSWDVFNTGTPGFPSNTIRCMVEDTAGVLWVGTDWGLCRFENEEWIVYQAGAGGLPANEINCLAVDSANRLWVGTLFNGIAILEAGGWSYLTSADAPYYLDEVNGITHDHRGWVWIGTPLGLVCWTGTEWRRYDNTPESYQGFQFFLPSVRATVVREDGVVGVATTNGGLIYLTEEDFINYTTFNSFFPDNSSNAIALDANGDRWLACPAGGLVWHTGDAMGGPWFAYNAFTAGLPDNSMTSITVDGSDTKIVGTQASGVLLFTSIDQWSALDQAGSGLPDDHVLCALRGRDGVLWAGTATQGLARYTPAVGMEAIVPERSPGVFVLAGSGSYQFKVGSALSSGGLRMVDVQGRTIQAQVTMEQGSVFLEVFGVMPGSYWLMSGSGSMVARLLVVS